MPDLRFPMPDLNPGRYTLAELHHRPEGAADWQAPQQWWVLPVSERSWMGLEIPSVPDEAVGLTGEWLADTGDGTVVYLRLAVMTMVGLSILEPDRPGIKGMVLSTDPGQVPALLDTLKGKDAAALLDFATSPAPEV